MNRSIAVAVSGGVDSMVAAHLLKQQTPEVFAIHFRTGFETEPADRILRRIQSIGEQMGIPVHVIDLSADFKCRVVDYFATTYLSGETPNPCMVCNPHIKFGALLRVSEALGADVLATGHYARVRMDASGRYRLFKGVDARKDQSYFLARLTQSQLAKACFPLGALTKTAVKEIAAREGLNAANAEESQDICFIKAGSYRQLVASLAGRTPAPGLIETTAGQVVGRHPGLHAFTIGQRRGINCPAAEPYYVVRLDIERNRLVVGHRSDLLAGECRVVRINWVAPPPAAAIQVRARVRYRTPETSCTLIPMDDETARVQFAAPQAAVTPGQAAVFYDDDEVLGGGFISTSCASSKSSLSDAR
jgi:tRNA-specific 2-thiouridylase